MAAESDLAHIGRLKEEEEKALQETLQNVKQWETFGQDYSVLQQRLKTLPDKLTHQVMVPFGKLAFMPGQLVHTNEIMVLLGDNWFAKRSAKQAREIIDRRKAHIQSMVDDLQKQRYLLESRLGFVSDMKGTVEGSSDVREIHEEYDPEKEAKWREERKARRKEAANSKTKVSSPSSSKQQRRDGDDDETEDDMETKQMTGDDLLWARLHELERQEEELDELAMMSDEENNEEVLLSERCGTMSLDRTEHSASSAQHSANHGASSAQHSANHSASLAQHSANQKHVHWGDQRDALALDIGLNQEGAEEDEDDDEEGDDDQSSSRVIHFSHTNVSSPHQEYLPNTDLFPRSPGDIVEQYQSITRDGGDGARTEGQVKSILNHSTSHPDSESVTATRNEKRKPLSAPVSAFSGSIVEHSQTDVTKPIGPAPQGQGSQRVSKFKAARQGRR